MKIVAALITTAPVNTPTPGYASVNPQEYNGGTAGYFGDIFSIPQLPQAEPEEESEGSGDGYMTEEEMRAEYCDSEDPLIQIQFCYLSQVEMGIDGLEIDYFEDIMSHYRDTGGDISLILASLKQSEQGGVLAPQDIVDIIVFVVDFHFFKDSKDLIGEERDYYQNAYLPLGRKVLERYPHISTILGIETLVILNRE